DEREATGRLGLHAGSERAPGEHRDRPHPCRCPLATHTLGASVVADHRLRFALEQQHQARGLLILLGDHGSGRHAPRARERYPLGERIVVEVVEEIDRAELLELDWSVVAHPSTRYSWISDTAIEPSPTALATRLIERARTSPATNTPGTEVSST